jgi:hypothetical protein
VTAPRTQWDNVRNPGGFIHGALVAGTTLAVATTADDTVRQTVAATIVVLVIYWATHSYTEALGERIADPHERPSVVVRHAAKQERSIFVGGLPGVATFVVASAAGADVASAGNIAMWATIVLLGSAGYAVGRRGGATGWLLAGEVATATLLGIFILVLKQALQYLH